MKLLMIPTWFLLKATQPFLSKGHYMKSGISFEDWTKHSTDIGKSFSILMWFHMAMIVIYCLTDTFGNV